MPKLAHIKLSPPRMSTASHTLVSNQTEYNPVIIYPEHQTSTFNIVFDIMTFQSVLNAMAHCNKCGIGKLNISPPRLNKRTASKLLLECNNCDTSTKSLSSGGDFCEKLELGSSKIAYEDRPDIFIWAGHATNGSGLIKVALHHAFPNILGRSALVTLIWFRLTFSQQQIKVCS